MSSKKIKVKETTVKAEQPVVKVEQKVDEVKAIQDSAKEQQTISVEQVVEQNKNKITVFRSNEEHQTYIRSLLKKKA